MKRTDTQIEAELRNAQRARAQARHAIDRYLEQATSMRTLLAAYTHHIDKLLDERNAMQVSEQAA